MKIFFSVAIGKLIILILKLAGKRGTALPGLVVEKFNHNLLSDYRDNLGIVIAVTGTNGKTSTQNTISYLLTQLTNKRVLSNSRGANLSRGLLAEIIHKHRLFKNNHYEFSVLEVEEATLPKIINKIRPEYLIVTNFFRDQLDAYGEIERTKQHIINAIQKFPSITIIANADDPQVINVLEQVKPILKTKPILVSIKDFSKFINYEPSDSILNEEILIEVVINNLKLDHDLKPQFNIDNQHYQLSLPGYHNVYSFGFSFGLLTALDLINSSNYSDLIKLTSKIPVPFGRGEIINNQQIFLIKNPVGFNLMLDLLAELTEPITLVILINDQIADGRDVSWLWDSNLEKISKLNTNKIFLAGTRAKDMLLRIKYADQDKYQQSQLVADYSKLKDKLQNVENVKVLATYTAMNQYREVL